MAVLGVARPQGGWLAAIYYPFRHPTPYAYENKTVWPGKDSYVTEAFRSRGGKEASPFHFRTNTEKPRSNKSEWTKYFVLYIRGFVIAGAFYYQTNKRQTYDSLLYCRNFVIQGVIKSRFPCNMLYRDYMSSFLFVLPCWSRMR
jgi:hypothetical protein